MTRLTGRSLVFAMIACAVWGCATGGGISRLKETQSLSYGERLLFQRCDGCHAVPDPRKMNAERWRRSIIRMQGRMHLPQEEWDSLLALGVGTGVKADSVH